MKTARRIEGYTNDDKTECEDRAEWMAMSDALAFVVADGAGGRPGGSAAAQAVVAQARTALRERPGLQNGGDWAMLLGEIDSAIRRQAGAGETTAIVGAIVGGHIVGASAGDSGAWLVAETDFTDLTRRQARKPFVGTGAATATAFETDFRSGTLLIASDGLFKYADPEAICEAARLPDIDAAADALLALVRLRSGKFQDDVALLLCRPEPTDLQAVAPPSSLLMRLLRQLSSFRQRHRIGKEATG